METMSKVEELAFQLSTKERATLASKLLRTLPEFMRDDDDGYAEAMRRQDEFLANPEVGITPEEARRRIAERFDI